MSNCRDNSRIDCMKHEKTFTFALTLIFNKFIINVKWISGIGGNYEK